MAKAKGVRARTEVLGSLYRTASAPARRQIVWMHQELERQFEGSQAAGPLLDPLGIAAGLQQLVQEGVDRMLATDKRAHEVKCQRGCSACCRLHVVITRTEAKLAKAAAEDVGWRINLARASLQAQATTADLWKLLPEEVRACVFLTDAGECAIYEHRPMACRKYLVVSDPADCDSVLKPGHRVLQLVSAHAEVAFSAALTVFEAGTLAAMLLAETEESEAAT